MMKKIIVYLTRVILMIIVFSSCHKIDVPIRSALTPEIFPQNESQFIQAAGPVYATLRGDYSSRYWFMQSLSTDEAVLLAHGGNWLDNQNYSMLHYHSWNKDHGFTNSTWDWITTLIGTTNQTISILKTTMPEGDSKNTMIAELKMVHAFAYFMLMDLYGNVPLYTEYGDFESKTNASRTEVFNYVESEIKLSLPYLSSITDVSTYGRPTKYAAYALLAKMYLNAEYYTGTSRYNECIEVCDNIINDDKFAIEPRESYLKMFYPDNGPAMKEFIFAIPYDPTAISISGTHGYLFHGRYDVPRSLRSKYSLPYTPEGPEGTLPEYYAHFNDPLDIRNGQWLTGLQYYHDGTPVTVNTTKQGYDQFYTGEDGTDPYTYHVNITPDIILRQDPLAFDVGNDQIGWHMGYRNVKFYPDSLSTNRNQNNDKPIFRYADILLMKAEAILRGGSPTLGHSPVVLANMVRSNRTTSAPFTEMSLESLYAERCREFAWEGWHRNDMIRFGKFEDAYGFKTNADIDRRIFPIPTSAMVKNPALVQNPGY